MLAGGGLIRFGTMTDGKEADRVRMLAEKGVNPDTILDNESKVAAFYKRKIAPLLDAYNEIGSRGEEINRAALYKQLVANERSHAEASLLARDLMDFSMQGSFTTIRFLTQVVPFMNARMQGLYKLGRSAKEDPQKFGVVLGAVALASIVLMMAAHRDDDDWEDWKKREDWDKNNYWWLKIGSEAYRIPKPFEIGAIATLAERGLEMFFNKDMTGKRFGKNVLDILGDNLNFNPIPQMIKPIIDVYANTDGFTGRPIESMSMEKLAPEYRHTANTSMTARALSTAGNKVTGSIGKDFLSPVQIDHLIRGYFSWLGTFVVWLADLIARPATGQKSQPTPDYWKTATGGMIADTNSASSYYVSAMYAQAREIEQAYGTYRMLKKERKIEEAREFKENNIDKLRLYHRTETVKRTVSKINERIRTIERSDLEPDDKRTRINYLQNRKDRVAMKLSAKFADSTP